MNTVITSAISSLLAALLGGVFARLGLDPQTTAEIIGALAALIGVGIVVAYKAALHSSNAVIQAAAKLPEVEKIVVASPAKADAIPSDKVVSGN